MNLTVDPASATTLYEQVRTQLIEQIASGELIAGTKLPTVRQLATDLNVAPYTVARVYRILEQDGFLETRGRNGTVVKAKVGTAEEILQVAANEYASRASELGISAEAALDYAQKALRL